MQIIIGEAEAAVGRRDQMLEVAATMAAATRADEGCRLYGFYTDITNPDVLLSVEVWRDQAALDAHMTHGHTKEFLTAVPDLVDGAPSMHLFRAEPAPEEVR